MRMLLNHETSTQASTVLIRHIGNAEDEQRVVDLERRDTLSVHRWL